LLNVAGDPKKDSADTTKEPYKTLFVSNLAYDLSDEDVKHEFEYFGPVKKVRLVLTWFDCSQLCR